MSQWLWQARPLWLTAICNYLVQYVLVLRSVRREHRSKVPVLCPFQTERRRHSQGISHHFLAKCWVSLRYLPASGSKKAAWPVETASAWKRSSWPVAISILIFQQLGYGTWGNSRHGGVGGGSSYQGWANALRNAKHFTSFTQVPALSSAWAWAAW